ncbi:hypothetical protein [Nocardioides sp.]|nr:hypothetical protein [Nocardioides sp.]
MTSSTTTTMTAMMMMVRSMGTPGDEGHFAVPGLGTVALVSR